jgi:hypothetical protein
VTVVLSLGIGGCTVERDENGCVAVDVPARDNPATPETEAGGSVSYWFCAGGLGS